MSAFPYPGSNATTSGVGSDRFGLRWVAGAQGRPGLLADINDVGLKQTVISGGAAGDHTVTGIATTDTLVSVLHLDMGGNAETDLTSEFSITATNTINNVGGTDTSADTLIVAYMDASANLAAATDRDFQLTGVNASSDDVTFNPEGGLILTTDGADGDENILSPRPSSAWGIVTWGTDKEVIWECSIQTGSAAQIGNAIIWAGLKLTSTEVTATDNDQAFFRYENGVNSGKFQAIYSIGGTDTAGDSGVTVAASTTYVLRIQIDSSRIAKFYINGALVGTSTALTNTTDLVPFIGVAADGAAEVKVLNVFGQNISRALG